jgi:hypothetical protein
MKRLLFISLILITGFSVLSAQGGKSKFKPEGNWQFEAPLAPEGFTTGVVEVIFKENKYSASMSFTGSDYKLPGEQVKFENDSLSFSIYVETENVAISLKADGPDKMNGLATYSEGEIPLTLVREKK